MLPTSAPAGMDRLAQAVAHVSESEGRPGRSMAALSSSSSHTWRCKAEGGGTGRRGGRTAWRSQIRGGGRAPAAWGHGSRGSERRRRDDVRAGCSGEAPCVSALRGEEEEGDRRCAAVGRLAEGGSWAEQRGREAPARTRGGARARGIWERLLRGVSRRRN